MKSSILLYKLLLSTIILIISYQSIGQTFSKDEFKKPLIQYWPRPLWFWNNTAVNEDEIVKQMQAIRDQCGYGGFGVLPFGKKFRPEYLSDNYLKLYGVMLEKAKELNMTVSLYDEFGFPSGSVGATGTGDGAPRFKLKFPEQTIKRLDKSEEEVSGPLKYEKKIPKGILMGAVAMNTASLKRIDLSKNLKNGVLKWKVPSGKWKIMFFNCLIDGIPIVDYLDPEAVKNFTKMVHEIYYNRFKEFFGTVIHGTFYDEPSMFHAKFRMWTDQFNDKFRKKYGFSPVLLYPALWYDIGADTQSARNYLFGFRAELYSEGFPKVVGEWSAAHGVSSTGHTAPEEALIPVNSSGDLMKSFKYQEIPGIDKIGGHRPAELFYKIISSAAYNWDKKLVMSETYGAMPDPDPKITGNLSWNEIYSIAMDQYAKGINMLIPHAVWYDDRNVTFIPEFSNRNPLYADSLKIFTQFLARLNMMLQKSGRHVADIAVLYPISALIGEHSFDGPKGPSNIDGWVDPANEYYRKAISDIDYINIASWLTNVAGKDFTFLHPEVLDEKCRILNGRLQLQNKTNWEFYKILIVPSCKTISVSNLEKIVDFYKNGGKVIFTTRLPFKSAETGKDRRIVTLMQSILPLRAAEGGKILSNSRGGKVCFISHSNATKLREVLQQMNDSYDVDYPLNENIRYIHKVINNRNLFYFANVGGGTIESEVKLIGDLNLEEWDPHSGESEKVIKEGSNRDTTFTHIKLSLKPYHSCFWLEKK
jgi:hypothetical protein